MADIKYYDVILKPVITEKSMAAMGEKKYTFLVHVDATKSQVKEAVEKMFAGATDKVKNTVSGTSEESEFKTCPQCGATIKSKAKFCGTCGYKF